MAPVHQVPGADDDALILIDATSGAGGLPVEIAETDALLLRAAEVFCLRRWPVACVFPRRPGLADEITASGRWCLTSSACPRRSTTRARSRPPGTPAVATLALMG